MLSLKSRRLNPSELRRQEAEEAIDYLPPDSIAQRQWQRTNRHRGNWDRWLVTGLVGVCVGIVGFLLRQLTHLLSIAKLDLALRLSEQSWFLCWIFVVFAGLLLLAPATWIVVYLRPSAGGSGMPELIGFLNGSLIRHIFNVKTFVVKFASTLMAVSSGLPVGPEGPMIHMGALIGAGISQMRSTTLSFEFSLWPRLRNTRDHRDFISAGAAAGIASVFGAPVGGLLFVMEEVASFWSHTLALRIFLCCCLSTFTTALLGSAFNEDFGLNREAPLGQLVSERLVLFRVHIPKEIHVSAIASAIAMGLIGGLLGAIFVHINLHVNRRRRDGDIIENTKLRRISEPLVLLVIFLTIILVLPTLFACQPIECVESNHIDVLGDSETCRLPQDHYCLDPDEEKMGVAFEKNVHAFGKCSFERFSSENLTLINGTYSQLATLILSHQETTLRHLFSRNTNLQFDVLPLTAYMLVYFLFACLAAGLSVSSGLMLPLLTIGALYGRLLGQLMVTFFETDQRSNAWMDPGALALLGAVSFLAGVTRLTISLTVIVLEMTNDVDFLLLVMITALVAKNVADRIAPALYQGLLDLKCIPHLNYVSRPRAPEGGRLDLRLFEASHVMQKPVVTAARVESSSRLAQILTQTSHGAFPVYDLIDNKRCFVGTISRFELENILVDFVNLNLSNQNGLHKPILPFESLSQVLNNIGRHSNLESEGKLSRLADSADRIDVDLSDYVNLSALSVPRHFSLERTYSLFRQLGLRHLVVVDESNAVAGIITRKDLTTTNLEKRLAAIPREIHDQY